MKMNAKLLAVFLPLSAIAAATEPQASDRVVGIFAELSKVPRYSGHEMNIGDWLIKWAADQGFNPTRDAAGRGNVIFDVPAAWEDGVLSITGSGKVDDFASAAELPWAAFAVTNMTLAAGVTPGKNTFAGLADAATVNGAVPISLLRAAAGDFIVGNLAPAEASALKVENGEVKMTVEVEKSVDLQTWKLAKTVDVAVPAEGEKGYYILKSSKPLRSALLRVAFAKV